MMCAEKNEESIDGLSGVTFEHDVVSDHEELSMADLEFGLCIPQDRLEDVDFCPKFDDAWIRLDDLAFEETSSPHKHNKQDSVDSSSHKHDSVIVLSDSYDNGEIESNAAANTLGKSLNLESCCYYAEEDKWKKVPLVYKKPRGKKSRKENRNMSSFAVSRSRKRTSAADCRERMKCTHCQAKDTPQWRLGPLGPNTLCNACGLRYKVGRLLENYRPAASPTFDSAKHSNFYKRLKR